MAVGAVELAGTFDAAQDVECGRHLAGFDAEQMTVGHIEITAGRSLGEEVGVQFKTEFGAVRLHGFERMGGGVLVEGGGFQQIGVAGDQGITLGNERGAQSADGTGVVGPDLMHDLGEPQQVGVGGDELVGDGFRVDAVFTPLNLLADGLDLLGAGLRAGGHGLF